MRRNRKRNIGKPPANNSPTLGKRVQGERYDLTQYCMVKMRIDQPTVVRSLECVGGERPARKMTRKKARLARGAR